MTNQEEHGDRPRDQAGKITLDEGTGPIVAMCSLADILEVYKMDMCFEVLTPDSIDPKQIDPNAPWIVSNATQYGSQNEIVARVFLQASEAFNTGGLGPECDVPTLLRTVSCIRNALLECDRICRTIAETERSTMAAKRRPHKRGNVIKSFPRAAMLRNNVGSFLMNAKDGLRNSPATHRWSPHRGAATGVRGKPPENGIRPPQPATNRPVGSGAPPRLSIILVAADLPGELGSVPVVILDRDQSQSSGGRGARCEHAVA